VELVGITTIKRQPLVFRIKICGVLLEQDVRDVAAAGADAIGLNFFEPSIRYVDPAGETTRRLADLAGQLELQTVGVFVDQTAAECRRIADGLNLDAIQLHGDQQPELARQLIDEGRRVIRAVKLPTGPLADAEISRRVTPWSDLGCQLLLDADAGRRHGGSGKTLDWDAVRQWTRQNTLPVWTLAGGLRPENVAEAIATSGARSVDTASGVECPKGVKNRGRIEAFSRLAAEQFGGQNAG